MIARKLFPSSFASAPRRSVIASAVAVSLLLAGCGGGATGGSSAPVASDSRASLPDAVSRSFAPNYDSRIESHGIWRGRTLRVFFPGDADAAVGSAALTRWEEATGGFFHWERAPTSDTAQVSFNLVGTDTFEPGVVGKTHYAYDASKNELTSADVRIARSGPVSDQVATAVHELGHALGIHGHSDATSDMMFASLTSQSVITERDLNTLFYLYRDSESGVVTPGRAVHMINVTIECGASR